MATKGTVYLVGAGPGDPGLITLRGRELIERCDVLVYDFLAAPIMRTWTKPDCEHIYVGKRSGRHTVEQPRIQDILVEKAKAGKSVVRLKGGDPLIFGRGGEEAVRLREAGVTFEIVPGITAALATAAYAGIPLTQRELSSSVSFLTGHEDIEKERLHVDFKQFSKTGGSLCIYMGVGRLKKIVDELLAGGLDKTTPAAIVQWATTPQQRTLCAPLADLPVAVAEAGISAPAVIMVGDVAKLRPEVSWYEQRPLFGKRIVITRNQARASALTARLIDLGADVIEMPLIEVELCADTATAEDVLASIASYQWIVFTSPNGVKGFFNVFYERFGDLRCFGPMRIACVGESTAKEVRKQHLEVDLVPDEFTGEALGKALIKDGDLENQNVLLITGNRNDPKLAEILEGEGAAIIDKLQVYETKLRDLSEDPAAERFRSEGADALVFSSSSAVESFAQQVKQLQTSEGVRIPKAYSIGPKTSETLKKLGIPIAAEAEEHSPDGLVDLLLEKLGI